MEESGWLRGGESGEQGAAHAAGVSTEASRELFYASCSQSESTSMSSTCL